MSNENIIGSMITSIETDDDTYITLYLNNNGKIHIWDSNSGIGYYIIEGEEDE
jgi:WD40 repeat protein